MKSRVLLVLLLLLNTIVVASATNVPEVFGDEGQTTVTGRLGINYPEDYPASYYLIDSLGIIELIPGAGGAGPLYEYEGAFIQVTGNLVTQDDQRTLYMEKWEPLEVHAAGWEPQPATGEQKIVMIVIDFPDLQISHNWPYYFQDIMTGPSPSMNAYFIEDSYGKITINGAVAGTGPFRANHNQVDYHVWTWDSCTRLGSVNYYALGNEAIQKADPYINYNIWNHIIIVAPRIWGCRIGDFTPWIWTDEGMIHSAAFVSEGAGLTTYVHEFSHDIGLPDLYDYSCNRTPRSATCSPYHFIGGWDPMGGWSDRDYPQHHSAFSKMRLGWIPAGEVKDVDLASLSGDHTATIDMIEDDITTTNGYHAVRIGINPSSSNQYFLVETRWKVLFDVRLPGWGGPPYASPSPDKGVLITYVDRDKGSGDGVVRLQPPSPNYATDTCDQQPITKLPEDGDAVWRVGETYANNYYGFAIAITSFIGTPSGGGFRIVVSYPHQYYAVNFLAKTLGGALLSGAAPTVSYQIDTPTPTSGTGTVPFTVWVRSGRTITYTYQGTVSGPGVTYVFDHDDHGGTLTAQFATQMFALGLGSSTRCFFSPTEVPSGGGTGCGMQMITGFYSSSITPPLVVVLAAVAPTTIPTGTLFTWMLSFTIIAAVDSSNVIVQGSFDPTVNVTSICVDDVCTQANEFKVEWLTMLAGTSHIVTVTGVGSFDYPGVVALIRDVSVAGDSPSGAVMIPLGPWNGPEVRIVGGEELPVGGEVYSPSATVMFLPWLLLMLAAIGATTILVWKRY